MPRHVRGQVAEDLAVAARLAQRRDGGAVEQHVGMPVAAVDVPVLDLRGGRQHVVGQVGRVGHELLQHHGEQVLARKAGHDLGRLGRHGHGIAVVDHDGVHARAEAIAAFVQQGVADGAHVDGARAALAQQVRHLQSGALRGQGARGGQQQAAGTVAPGAHQGRQAGDGAHGIAAAARALHAVVQADGGGRGGAIVARQLADLLHGQAADLGRALGRPLQGAGLEFLPAQRVARDVVMVQPAVRDQLVHQGQRQGGIGAGQQLQVLVAFVGGLGLARVYAHQARAVALGLQCIAPEMQAAADAVAAPDEDEPAFGEMLHAHAQLAAIGQVQGLAPGAGADGAVQQRGAELVEEAPVHALALHQAHGACVAVGQDGFGIARRQRVQPGGDVGQRLVPAHGLELPGALGAHAAQRGEHTLGVVAALGVFADLGAEHAARVRMVGVALDSFGDAVFDRGHQRAGIGAVMGAGAQDL